MKRKKHEKEATQAEELKILINNKKQIAVTNRGL